MNVARLPVRCLPGILAVALAFLPSAPALAATDAPVRPAASRPVESLWPVTRLFNADYIDVKEIAARYDLKAAWVTRDKILQLSDARGVRFKFEKGQYDFYFDGLRVFLGTSVVGEKDSLFLSKLDVIKLIAPLIRPADHAAQLPAHPPKIIVLDPGHGGTDPGTENKRLGLNEKTFTLDVALRLKKILEANGYRVLLTRSDDHVFSADKKADLQMRDEFTATSGADLFISIHFNSAEAHVTGIETYTMAPQFMISTGERKDDMTGVAYPGNRLDYANLLFGEQMHRAMVGTLRTPDRGFKRGRRAVLRLLNCPGLLVECAYLSNDAEARRVATPEFRDQIALGIAKGVTAYSAALTRLHPAPAAPAEPPPASSAPASTPPAPR